MAPSDSCLALSRKPQVLTMTISAPSCLRAEGYELARSRVMMRSESTSALGHPNETKLILGAAACCIFHICVIDRQELVPFAHNYKALQRLSSCYGCIAGL